MAQLSDEFLEVLSQDKVEVARQGRERAEEAEKTIDKETATFQESVLKPQNQNWFEGKAALGSVAKELNDKLKDQKKATRKFWVEHKEETNDIFGFGYNQARKHIVLYENKKRLFDIFEDCFDLFERNLDKVSKIVAAFNGKAKPTREQVDKTLKAMKQAAAKKSNSYSKKRKRQIEQYETEKRRRITLTKHAKIFVAVAEQEGKEVPPELVKVLEEIEKEEKETEKAEEQQPQS